MNSEFLLHLFDKKNLSNNGFIALAKDCPIYFVLKECDDYTHEIIFDPYQSYSKGQSGENRTIFKKGLNYGFSYMINHFERTYEDMFRQDPRPKSVSKDKQN